MRVAPEVEKLMWTIADTNDKAAQDNFERLFPDLRNELLRRIRLVSEIKEAKAFHIKPVPRPAFALKPMGRFSLTPRRALYSSVLIVGVALAAAASYVAVSRHNQPAPYLYGGTYLGHCVVVSPSKMTDTGPTVSVSASPALTTPPPLQTQPAVSTPTAGVPVQAPPTEPQPQDQTPPASQDFPVYAGNTASSQTLPQPTPAAKPADDQGTFEAHAQSVMTKPENRGKPMVLFRHAKLSTAINAISHQYGVNVSTATDMPNPEIDGEFFGDDAASVLNSIGEKYNFTVAKESRSHLLLVPNLQSGKHGPVKRF